MAGGSPDMVERSRQAHVLGLEHACCSLIYSQRRPRAMEIPRPCVIAVNAGSSSIRWAVSRGRHRHLNAASREPSSASD